MKTLIKTLLISSLSAVAFNAFAVGSSEPANPYVYPVFDADHHGEHAVPAAMERTDSMVEDVEEAKEQIERIELARGGRGSCAPPDDCSSRWIIR